jgi:pSer/pThr/pTyr-binding forkhead associated (FHA) protein
MMEAEDEPAILVWVAQDAKMVNATRSTYPAERLAVGRVAHPSMTTHVLAYDTISRHHLSIIRQGGALFVADEFSTSGTFVNRHRIPSGELVNVLPSDIIQVGHLYLRVALEGQQLGAEVQPAQHRAIRITLIEGDGPEQRWEFASGRVRIGRRSDNDLILSNPNISREHMVLEVRDGALWLVGLATQAGVQVQGVNVGEGVARALAPDDVVTTCTYTLRAQLVSREPSGLHAPRRGHARPPEADRRHR